MNFSKRVILTAIPVLLFVVFPLVSYSQVFHHPNPTANLIERWDWAIQEAGKQKLKVGYWIGYSIRRLMWEHQYICSTEEHTISSSHFPDFLRGDPLEKILSGKVTYTPLSDEEKVRLEARRALSDLEGKDKPMRKVWKDVAILYKFVSSSPRIPETFRI
ncbi:MAG: hypothetical protein PVF66_09375, partial [Candidatus Aminicenantes bacterium]